jgi:hypothetical protein
MPSSKKPTLWHGCYKQNLYHSMARKSSIELIQ